MLARLLQTVLRRGRTAAQSAVRSSADIDRLKRALALERSGQAGAAERLYRDLLRDAPDDADVSHLLGNVLRRQGRFSEAIEFLRCAVRGSPPSAIVHFHLGETYARADDNAHATECYRRALEVDASFAPAARSLGNALRASGALDAAAAAYERAIELNPELAELHIALGDTLRELGRREDALAACIRATQLQPASADAHIQLGHALHELGRVEPALAAYRCAVELRPDQPEVHLHLGGAIFSNGLGGDAAAPHFLRALELRPDFIQARFNLGLTQLAGGDLADGWQNFELRYEEKLGARRVARAALPQPQWKGEDLRGKSLLVWGEQGVGDQIQFAGLLPELLVQASRLTIVCLPKLKPLFARSFPAAVVTSELPLDASGDDFDFQCSAGGAAQWLRPAIGSFPTRRGYLVADAARVVYWRERLDALGAGLKIGFSWRSHDLRGDRVLACSNILDWAPLFSIPGVHWICLQYDDCVKELAAARGKLNASLMDFPEIDLRDDLDETAALMTALDYVISAPTTVSVLAAALGVKTWQMTYGYDWQTHGTDRNLWFPAMRQYRRSCFERWEAVTARMALELREKVRAHGR